VSDSPPAPDTEGPGSGTGPGPDADPEPGSDPEAGSGPEAGPGSRHRSPFVPDELLRRERVPGYAWALLGLLVVLGVVALLLTSMDRGGYAALFVYSIPSNTAISLLPHEPVLLIYGGRANVWVAGAVATIGTMVAGWLDHRIFVPVLNVERIVGYKESRLYRSTMRLFERAPFAALVVAGLSPVPYWPFKLLAFSRGYSVARYLAAIGVGRFPRYALLLWVGSAFHIPTWVLVAAALLAFLAYGVHFLVRGDEPPD
jgi:membrane protein YqaA with SNARE-associated domain